MSIISSLWAKFAKSKAYRRAYVASYLKRSIPFQITAMRKARGWSQENLAAAAGLTQGVVSRAENPDYGNLTFNTILHIAAGFDVAFVGQFIPFSELARRVESLSEESVRVPTFLKDAEPQPEESGIPSDASKQFVIQPGTGQLVMQPGTGKSHALVERLRIYLCDERRAISHLAIPATITPPVGTKTQIPGQLGREAHYREPLWKFGESPTPTLYSAANTSVSGSLTNPLVEAHS